MAAHLWKQGGRAPLSNKSAGVLLALRKAFTSGHVYQTWTPPASMLGRAVAARLKGGFFSISICSSVVSTFHRDHKQPRRGGYQRTVDGLLGRLDDRLSEQRHRTPPANDGLVSRGRPAVHFNCGGACWEHVACKRLMGRSRRSITCVPHQQRKGVRATWFGDGRCPRRIRVLLKRSLFDALAHSDAWHLRKIFCHWVLSLITCSSRAAGAG